MESAVIIGRRPRTKRPAGETLGFRRVRERDAEEFKRSYKATTRRLVDQSRFESDLGYDLRIPELEQVWISCRQHAQTLNDLAELGQGLVFHGRDLPENAVTFESGRFQGGERGFVHFDKQVLLHELPHEYWLNLSRQVIRRPQSGTTTGIPQVLLNYAPASRGPWRLKALIDQEGHAVTSRFVTVRPRTSGFGLEFLWAILNSPIANGYAYAHLGKRDNLVGIVRRTPVPKVEAADVERAKGVVRRYLDAVSPRSDQIGPTVDVEAARELLFRVDAEVLRLYRLPANLERELLDLFATWRRPGVPFLFERYYPEHFKDAITLQEFLAITHDWRRTNRRRGELIDKKVARHISPEEQAELDRLQTLADKRVRLVAPLPSEDQEALRHELVAAGE